MKKLFSIISTGAWIVIIVAVLVGGQWLWKFAHHPKHLDALAEESGNLNFTLENERPQISHDGSRLLFCHSSENGVSVFIHDMDAGWTKLLFEEKEIHFGMGPHGVLTPFPWSPDDKWFVYAHQGPGAINEEFASPEETALTICRADTDAEDASLIAPFGRVVALEWLTTNSFVYVDGTEAHDFMLVQRSEGGGWRQKKLNTPAISTTNDKHFCALAAVSSDTILWLQANSLWRMNVYSNSVEKLCALPKDKFFTSFDYSKETEQLLLSCIEKKADSLWQMPLGEPGNLTKIATDIHTHDNSWNDAQWINGGRGYAFIRKPGLQRYGLVIKTDTSMAQTILFPTNYIQYIVPAERQLFVLGEINDQPGESIWKYDITTGSNQCVISGFDTPPIYFKAARKEFKNIRISAREKLDVVIFPPKNFDPKKHKKYPVVITSIRYALEDPYVYQYAETVANAGAWYVLINHTWSPRGLESWATHIRHLRDNMETNTAQFPNIDQRRMFVVSNSAQAMALADIFTNQPDAWRGAILLEPSTAGFVKPLDASMEQKPFRILITTPGRLGDTRALIKYQEDSAAEGMTVDWIVHPNTPHVFIAKSSQRDRLRAMLHFIFDE